MAQRKFPDWYLSIREGLPSRVRTDVEGRFTIHRDGYVRWYRGAIRFACGKSVATEKVEDHWTEKKKAIDADIGAIPAPVEKGKLSLRQVAAQFYEYLDHRVATGQPKPLSPVTRADYLHTLTRFGRCVGADRQIGDFGPDDFQKFAKMFAGGATSVLARCVAYVKAFFEWAAEEQIIPDVPKYGAFFKRPPQQTRRDQRIGQAKSYTPAEIRTLWDKANETQRLWLALGLTGAMDNADIANFTVEVIDWDNHIIDYRRRKRGKARRVIPMRPEVEKLLRGYIRPDPAPGAEHLFFLTANGLPLCRLKESTNEKRPGLSNTIDALAQTWRRLMEKAMLRPAPKVVESTGRGKTRRRKVKYSGADGRGFRSLRTTFPNLAPPGYREEVEIIMGHLSNTVLVEHYLESVGTKRLRELVDHVWSAVFTSPKRRGAKSGRRKSSRASALPA